ncbi:MAG TPA: serine/threonine-protein kinase [Candidatus Polarisedimenticolia bacterium]|nr:serine/threonine-protein kinase [Candidatus Polarisedimenticolia bacterium]
MSIPKNIGRYEIVEEVGRGSMGVVYRARDPRLGRIVALKCVAFSFPLAPGEEEEFLGRFYQEAQIAGRLSHPNIVTIHDVGTRETEGTAFIAMEYVTGTNLQELLAGGGRLPIPQVADVARQVADALDYAHGCGVVHRDIKPGNIVLTTGGQVKVLDFGIARAPTGDGTKPGRLLGTPNYMAPEQVTGGKIDGRADQFSLAVTLYHLLTGERPFVGESLTAISYQVVNVTPPPPSRLNPAVPADVDRILGRGLAKTAAERYPGCHDLAEEFTASLATWKEAADRAAPRTLVAATGASKLSSAGTGGGRGIAGILAGAGPGAVAGWTLFLGALGILALSPYLVNAVTRRDKTLPAAAAATDRPIERPERTGERSSENAPDRPEERPASTAVAPPSWLRLPPTPAPAPPPAAKPAARPTGTLSLSFQHKFESGILTVRVDGTEALRERLSSKSGKSLWKKSLPVAPGRRRIETRVQGNSGTDFDVIEGIDLDIHENRTQTLALSINPLTRRLKLRPGEEAR